MLLLNFVPQNNTFQCVVASDGTFTFVIFQYLDDGIHWTTGDNNGGTDGLGGTPAQVGFDAGDNIHNTSLPGSLTHDVINIEEKSNVDIPGLFVFQVNDEPRPPVGMHTVCITELCLVPLTIVSIHQQSLADKC